MDKQKSSFEKTINWLGKTQGRDKLCKVIQYGARIAKSFVDTRENYELGLKFEGLSIGVRNARKIFRLFKSIYEYQNMVRLMWQKIPLSDKIIRIISRVFYLIYWILDNIAILSLVRLWRFDSSKYIHKGYLFWFLGLFTYLIATIKSLINVQKQLNNQQTASQQNKRRKKELLGVRKQHILMLIKTIGDLIPSSQGCGLFRKVFKFEASDALVGWGGFISAIISNYQLFD